MTPSLAYCCCLVLGVVCRVLKLKVMLQSQLARGVCGAVETPTRLPHTRSPHTRLQDEEVSGYFKFSGAHTFHILTNRTLIIQIFWGHEVAWVSYTVRIAFLSSPYRTPQTKMQKKSHSTCMHITGLPQVLFSSGHRVTSTLTGEGTLWPDKNRNLW